MKFRSAYSGHAPSKHPVLEEHPHVVKQEFKKEVDINEIIRRMRAGISPPRWMTSATPRYGDFSSMPQSLMESFEIVRKAEESFESLPLEFRRELDHDPRNLDSAPRELFEKYGLLKKKPEAPESGSAASGGQVGQRVQGDRDLPGKAPVGAKKGRSAPQASEPSDTGEE